MDVLLESASVVKARILATETRRAGVELKLQQATQRASDAAELHRLSNSAKVYFEKAVDLVYQSSIGDLEARINQALTFVFSDRQFRIILQMEDLRGSKSVTFALEDSTSGKPLLVDLREGTGAGVRTVVSIIIHVYYLLSKSLEPILFVDEGYAYLAEEYVEAFFDFLKTLCSAKNFAFVLISHDKRFESIADSEYRLDLGTLTQVF